MNLIRAAGFALIALSIGLGTPAHAQKKRINNLKSNLKSVQGKKNSIEYRLKQTRSRVREVKGDINSIDSNITTVEGRIATTRRRLFSTWRVQRQLARELEEATERMNVKKEQVKKRLRWMYVNREESIASVLVSSRSIGDFASRSFLLQRIAQADRKLFDEFRELQRAVAVKKQRVDELAVEIAQMKKDQEARQDQLEDMKNDKEYILGRLRDKQDDLERLARQLDAEEGAIQARIAAYYNARSASGRPNLPAFSGSFGRPCNGRITSGYGMRHHPILKRSRMHTGVDFGAGNGSPIYAAAGGVVVSASYSGGYGNLVIIDHGGGITTCYAHCSRMNVRSGQSVRKGQQIANVGSTGLSTGPHLHFEVRVNGRPVNPMGRI